MQQMNITRACPDCGQVWETGQISYRLYGRYLCADCFLNALHLLPPDSLVHVVKAESRTMP